MKLISLLCLLVLVGCGKPDNSQKKTVKITPDQITNLLENQLFTCESVTGSACPDALARLFILNERTPHLSSLCSGFLTRSNRLITNAHCVSTDEECRQTYVVIHVQGDYQLARCQNILKLYEDFKPLEAKSLDVAVIELDRHFKALKVFQRAMAPLRIGQTNSAWVIDHVNLFEARITELECSLAEKGPSYIFKNCPAIGGNSGSPLVDNRGRVTAILWGATTDETIDELFPLSSRRLIESKTYATDAYQIRSFF